MKKIVLFVLLVGVFCFSGCETAKKSLDVGDDVSKINQPRAVPKKYTTITTVTETKPDGSSVTTRTTSVVVPMEDGTEKEALVGPDVIAMHKEGGPLDDNSKTKTAADPLNNKVVTNPNTPGNTKSTDLTTTAAEPDYMTDREREMIKEINLVRTNPKGYIQYIENYKKDIQKVKYNDIDYLERELIASDELIKQLRTMTSVSELKDHRELHNVAMGHGITIQKRGYSSHLGNDGTYPWDRISKAVPELIDGNENLVGGAESVRDAVILLLVDSGIQGRGHRKTILQKDWEYVACYEVGEVGGIKNYWVQNFAKGGGKPLTGTAPGQVEAENPADDFPNLTTSINQGPAPGTSTSPRTTITKNQPQQTTSTSSWGGNKTTPANTSAKPNMKTSPTTTTKPNTTNTTTKPASGSTWTSSNPIGSTKTNTTGNNTRPNTNTANTTAPNTATNTRPAGTTTKPTNTTATRPNPATTTTAPSAPPRANPTNEAAISSTTFNSTTPVEERKFDTGRGVAYLTTKEKDMILEINRVRANPQRYVRYIDEYRAKVKRNNNPNSPETKEELQAIDELKQQLSSMAPVSILEPSRAVHNAAKKHGEEMKSKGKVSHIGADGSYPWDRIIREDASLKDGNENLVGGPDNVRDAVISLLVDAGISGRGHRKNILNKDWKYVSCYEAGTIGRMKNTWVQNFAR
ncbi:MAG: CAP domain-containing protein [Bacteroidota bacterium]